MQETEAADVICPSEVFVGLLVGISASSFDSEDVYIYFLSQNKDSKLFFFPFLMPNDGCGCPTAFVICDP